LDLRNRQKSAWMRMPHPHCGWIHPHSPLKQWKSTQKSPECGCSTRSAGESHALGT